VSNATTTLTFTTPARTRVHHPVPVVFCGDEWTLQRPKDATLYFAQVVAAGGVGDADRAEAIMQFVNSVLDPVQRHRYFERIIDRADPVALDETLLLIGGLADRWTNWPDDGQPEPVIVEPVQGRPPAGESITVVHDDLEVRFVAHPPKDIVLLFAAASLAVGANLGQQAAAIGLFLDSALEPADALVISHRMRSQHDELDLEHVAEFVTQLAQTWLPGPANRAERRAAARTGGRA